MSITGPGSITANTVLAQTNMMKQLTTLSTELGSGQAAQTYSGLGSQAGLVLSLNAQLSAISGYSSTATTVGTTLTLAQSVLTQLGSSGNAVQQSISQQSAFSVDNTGQTQAQEVAASQLGIIVDLLNTQVGSNYMFSGSALNQPSVASANTILNGNGAQAGLKQVIAERQAADLGNGLGRLVIPASSGSVLSVGEDVAGSPFGFKIAGVNSSLTGASVTGPSAPPATYSIDLGPTNPNPGDSIQFNLTLPDGSSQSIALQAIANGTTQATSSYTTAQAVGGTGANAVVASVQSNVELSSAGIGALTVGDTINYTLGTTAVTATFGTTDAGNTFDDAAGLLAVLNATTNFGTNGATATTDGAGGVTLYSNDLSTDFTTTFTSTGLTATNLVTTAHSLGDALTLSDGTHSSSFYYVANNAQAADGTFNTNADLASAIGNATSLVHATITPTALAGGDIELGANNIAITVGGAIGSALGFSTTPYQNNAAQPGANQFTIGANTTATAANLQAALTATVTKLAQTVLPSASAIAAANNFFEGETQLTSPNTVASLATSGVTASVQSNVELSSAGIGALTVGDTVNYTLGTTAVTATFGTTDAGNTFDDAAGLIAVLNATTNFGTNGATALTDGAGGVTLYSNDLATDFATTFTSTGLTATNLVTTAHSLGDALTLSDGTHSSSFYYVANNAQAADGTFNTAANLVSALNNPATSTRVYIDGAAVGAGSAYLALSNFNGPITIGGTIGAALGFPSGAVDNNVNAPLRVSGPPGTATALVAGTAANTVFWYTGENGATSPLQTATAQVGPSTTIAYGIRANEQALTTLISNVALLAATTYLASDPNAQGNYQALSQHVAANLDGQSGTQQISDIEADLANSQITVKNATDLNTQTETTLTNMLQNIDGVNQTQIGELILTLQNNLSASMSVTGRLAQISLVNYLAPA